MSIGRVIGIVVVILVLYAIVSAPQDSASSVRSGLSAAGDAGSSITTFFSSLVDNLSTSTSSGSGSGSGIGDPVYPAGGVETGDGSARP